MEQNIEKFDLAVIGAGPGGYPAAFTAAQKGLKVALIEPKELGGTCLNRGCIPSKALIAAAETYHKLQEAKKFGIHIDNHSLDYAELAKHKDAVVKKMRDGLQGLVHSNGVTLIKGYARFISPHEIKITGEDNRIIFAEKTIIATGSEPRNISAFPCDHERILDSTSLLAMTKLPKSLVIIGGGVIGCEFASLYHTLGVEVTILELLPSIIPTESKVLREALTKTFEKRGIKIHSGVKVTKVERTPNGVKVLLENGEPVEAEIALVSVGRAMNTSDIGLGKAGITTEPQGTITVNDKMETNVDGIYAIGDIVGKWWLAHVASHQGVVAAKNAMGQKASMHYNAIPAIIFTRPEVASVGLSLEDAQAKGYDTFVGSFPFEALGKAQAAADTEGFAQVIIDKKTHQILGAQVIGHEASSLIAEMTTAITNELTAECIAETIHAHPTIAEVWHEAVLNALETPINWPPTRKKKAK